MAEATIETVYRVLPQRIQRKRAKGFRLPPGAVCVLRPSKWGNPYHAQEYHLDAAMSLYSQHLRKQIAAGELDLDELRGARFLACWCPLDKPCHVDVMLEALADA